MGLHIHSPVKFGMTVHTVKVVRKYELNASQVRLLHPRHIVTFIIITHLLLSGPSSTRGFYVLSSRQAKST